MECIDRGVRELAPAFPGLYEAEREQAPALHTTDFGESISCRSPKEQAETFVIVRNMRPDRFFSADQRSRLERLMSLRREAVTGNSHLPAHEAAELEQLVDAEVRAATERATALFHDLAR